MKRSNNFLKSLEKDNGDLFWKKSLIKPLGDRRTSINDEEFDLKPNIQAQFTKTKLKTKHMDGEGKIFRFNTLGNVDSKIISPKKF